MLEEKISILLVEDNPLAKKMSALFLEQLNCKVDAVSTASDATEYFNTNRYDLIFMDIGLPDMCGLTLIRSIREKSDVPIVVLTAHSDKGYIASSFKMGVTDFLIKPLSKELGLAMIQRYVKA